MSVVVSGDFFRFRFALPSLLFLSKAEFKAAHSDFDRCPRGVGLRTEKPPELSLWGWGKYCTLIDCTTRGGVKINLVPKFLPRPCPVCLFKEWPERSELGDSRVKRLFPAKCAGSFGIETCPRVQ